MNKHPQDAAAYGQAVIQRTIRIMQDTGYTWSKAMSLAADAVKAEQAKGKTGR